MINKTCSWIGRLNIIYTFSPSHQCMRNTEARETYVNLHHKNITQNVENSTRPTTQFLPQINSKGKKNEEWNGNLYVKWDLRTNQNQSQGFLPIFKNFKNPKQNVKINTFDWKSEPSFLTSHRVALDDIKKLLFFCTTIILGFCYLLEIYTKIQMNLHDVWNLFQNNLIERGDGDMGETEWTGLMMGVGAAQWLHGGTSDYLIL